MLTQEVDPENTIVGIAFSSDEATKITNILLIQEIRSQQRLETVLTNYLTTNFKNKDRMHCVLGGLNKLNDEPQQALIILQDPELSQEFITELRQLYNLPEHI